MRASSFPRTQWVEELWLLSFLLVALLLPDLFVAGAQQLTANQKHVALPQLSDGMGWKQSRYYSTIQTADIDGDGQSEVLARWINGLNVYRFSHGALVRHSIIPSLSDNAGFYQPSWYSTIHAAVLDPSRKQADVIAREHDGIHVFRYNSVHQDWKEIGTNASLRPFADTDAGGTDWTQAKYYSTIQLAHVTGDGATELIGRGRSGMQAWQWNSAKESWTQLAATGELADGQGFDLEPYYSSIQLIDVDGDGIAELLARAPEGVRTYKLTKNGWTVINSDGPFGDAAGLLVGGRYKSVRASLDATGQAWLYGVTAGSGGNGSGALQVYSWQKDHWQAAGTIPLGGNGWDRESQSATLRAADLEGDATPEFIVRGSGGLQAYSLTGDSIPIHSASFTDAQGWNLLEQSSTLQTATAMLAVNGGSRVRTIIIGRGRDGLETYQLSGDLTGTAAGFPQYCTNFTTDNSLKCAAYKAISQKVAGVDDVRPLYTEARYSSSFWKTGSDTVKAMANPNNYPEWSKVMQPEMAQELGDVSTVLAWFVNNATVLNNSYNRSADLLLQAQADVALASSTSVGSKWLEFSGDIAAAIAGFFPDNSATVDLVITILRDTYNLTAGPDGDTNEAISKLTQDLNNQRDNVTLSNANQTTAYLTNYEKLLQIGSEAPAAGFNWAAATYDDIANAEDGAAHGMLINFYRTLLPAAWEVAWCNQVLYGCGASDTKTKYNCQYGVEPGVQGYSTNAYIYAGSAYVNWTLLDRLTGLVSASPDNLNAIWYMMLLGGDLGWDLPQANYVSPYSAPVNQRDPQLAYDQIDHGYKYPSSSCAGNGSTYGIIGATQTLSQRLSVAQQNSAHITASAAPSLVTEIQALNEEAKTASPDPETNLSLTSPLDEAVKLIGRAQTNTTGGQEHSVSATTPTHLMELFIQRTQRRTTTLGEVPAGRLTTHAYCLIEKLEGQSPAGVSCSR